MMTLLKRLSLLLVAVFLIACGGPGGPVEPAADDMETPAAPPEEAMENDVALAGTAWELLSLHGQPPLPDRPVTLQFDNGEAGGNSGCNSYGGDYTASPDGDLAFGDLVQTLMACMEPEGIMEQEQAFMTALRQTVAFRLADGRLELLNEAGETTLIFTPQEETTIMVELEGTVWRLTTFADDQQASSLLAGTEITLLLEQGEVSGNAGCNQYHSSYTLDGETIALMPPAATRMYCNEPDGVMEQEQEYLAILAAVTGYEIDGRQLRLTADDGRALYFTAEPAEELDMPAAFPRQKPADGEQVTMQALLSGQLRLVDDCLRVYAGEDDETGLLPIWPAGYALEAEGDALLILDETGVIVARVGEQVELGGGPLSDEAAAEVVDQLPEQCPGPYWLVGEILR